MISILVISRCAAPLIRLRRTFPHPGGRIKPRERTLVISTKAKRSGEISSL